MNKQNKCLKIIKCISCGKEIEVCKTVNHKLCNECILNDPRPKKNYNYKNYFCKNCGKPISRNSKTGYCLQCITKINSDKIYNNHIDQWKKGLVNGLRGLGGGIAFYIRRYLFEKFDNKCSRCGWHEVNPFTGKIPLEVEHNDGNYKNNKEENLDLVCPNCHSLTATYKGANLGHGRPFRPYYNKK